MARSGSPGTAIAHPARACTDSYVLRITTKPGSPLERAPTAATTPGIEKLQSNPRLREDRRTLARRLPFFDRLFSPLDPVLPQAGNAAELPGSSGETNTRPALAAPGVAGDDALGGAGAAARGFAEATDLRRSSQSPIRSSKPAGRSSPPLGWFDSIAAPWRGGGPIQSSKPDGRNSPPLPAEESRSCSKPLLPPRSTHRSPCLGARCRAGVTLDPARRRPCDRRDCVARGRRAGRRYRSPPRALSPGRGAANSSTRRRARDSVSRAHSSYPRARRV